MRYCGQISFQYLFSLSFCHVLCRAKITQQVQKCINVAPENLLSDDTKVLERKVNKCWQSPCCWSLLNRSEINGLGASIHRKEGDIIMVDGLMNFFVSIVKVLCFYGVQLVPRIVSRETRQLLIPAYGITYQDINNSLGEKPNDCFLGSLCWKIPKKNLIFIVTSRR